MKLVAAALGLLLVSCGYHEPVPLDRAHDARFGYLGAGDALPPKHALCTKWASTVAERDPHANKHLSYPEANVQNACFTAVVHAGRDVSVGYPPAGCGYPSDAARRQLLLLADQLTALAGGDSPAAALFPCALPREHLTAAALQNARVLRALANEARTYPYAAVIVPGHGTAAQDETAIAGQLPSEECRTLHDGDLERLGAMPARAALGADALRGGVAPIAIVSGGAIHSHVVEAFALKHLLECREHIDGSRILLEPCAEHTHTNLRNSGRWVEAIGARAAYLVTDPGIQAEYFQDWSGFDLIFGSIDQRSLRDWGYLIGSWRQASVGANVGFWFTPYRFWAEPRDGLGSLTCVDD